MVNKDTDRFTDEAAAKAVTEKIKQQQTALIDSLTQKKVKEKQPLLYDLTELQKDANRQFKYSADQTLKLMQELYERYKILSYPRTSSRYLSSDIAPQCPDLLKKVSGIDEFSDAINSINENNYSIASRIIDDKKVTDHHAIIPTDKTPNLGELPTDHKNIYLMVIRRFVPRFCRNAKKVILKLLHRQQTKPYATGRVINVVGGAVCIRR